MKYFSERYITNEAITWLKRARRTLTTGKIVHFENSVELYDFEKPVFVYDRNDSLIEEIKSLQEGEYDYYSLSPELKKFMREKDNLFFARAYNEWHKRKQIEEIRQEKHIENYIENTSLPLTELQYHSVMLGDKLHYETPLEKKIRDSSRRTYKTVRDLIKANTDDLNYFVTLTFARIENKEKYPEGYFKFVNDVKDFEEVKNAYKNFMDQWRKEMKEEGKELKYIAVFEQHKDNSYHFHMLVNQVYENYKIQCPDWLDIDYKTNQKRNGLMLSGWNFGKSDIEEIRDKERMATYISKYITKSVQNLRKDEDSYNEYLNKKKYFRSKNLKKPSIEYNDNVNTIIEQKKETYTDIYESSYFNPYNKGNINKTILSNQIISN